jgi:AbrB family looped-hinge helix DNA binding protein
MAKVTSKLQVTLPKAIADRVGIRPGDEIEWRLEGQDIRVVPARGRPRLTLDERLRLFDESMKRQDARERAWRRAHGADAPGDRGWTRDDLYARGRAR